MARRRVTGAGLPICLSRPMTFDELWGYPDRVRVRIVVSPSVDPVIEMQPALPSSS